MLRRENMRPAGLIQLVHQFAYLVRSYRDADQYAHLHMTLHSRRCRRMTSVRRNAVIYASAAGGAREPSSERSEIDRS